VESPEILYHYTDAEGLLAILSTRSIRATLIEFLNDASELTYARNELWQSLDQRRTVLPPADESSGNTPERRLHRLNEIIRALDTHENNSGVFVTCFSADPDSLSQWRAYGTFAIGFLLSELRKMCESLPKALAGPHGTVPCNLNQVRYGLSPAIKDEIEALAARLDNARGGVGPALRGIAELHFYGYPLLATIKHPSFHEEKEWRMILSGGINGENVSFRTGRLGIIPYLNLPFEPAAVAEVVIGPSAEPSLRHAAVKDLLRINRYPTDYGLPDVRGVKVVGSNSPARL
jgi:hypothetical protein